MWAELGHADFIFVARTRHAFWSRRQTHQKCFQIPASCVQNLHLQRKLSGILFPKQSSPQYIKVIRRRSRRSPLNSIMWRASSFSITKSNTWHAAQSLPRLAYYYQTISCSTLSALSFRAYLPPPPLTLLHQNSAGLNARVLGCRADRRRGFPQLREDFSSWLSRRSRKLAVTISPHP
jgi:hypothetical protein